jgi:hypothetical protein
MQISKIGLRLLIENYLFEQEEDVDEKKDEKTTKVKDDIKVEFKVADRKVIIIFDADSRKIEATADGENLGIGNHKWLGGLLYLALTKLTDKEEQKKILQIKLLHDETLNEIETDEPDESIDNNKSNDKLIKNMETRQNMVFASKYEDIIKGS